MEIDFYDSEFIKILEAYMRKEEFQVVESSIYYEKVNSEIPFLGSRIDFNLLKEHKNITFKETDFENIFIFINDIITTIDTKSIGEIIYLGDSLTKLAYIFPFRCLDKIIVDVIHNIPQHHYFFDKTLSWVIFISFENYIEFGKIR
jgi:hypothetical protein